MAWNRLCLFLIILFAAFPINSMAADVFTVDVVVDVVDQNSAKAREKAMTVANRQAFISVLKKITTSRAVTELSNLNDNQIQNFVKEVSVLSEKVSNVRYIAELRVKFNDVILKRYLEEKNLPFSEDASFRVVVIPLFREFYSDKPILWEDENVWRKAWQRRQGPMGSVDFTVPEANSVNYEMLNPSKILDFDMITLDWVGRTNNAEQVYILDATNDGIDGMVVRIYAPSGSGISDNTVRISEIEKGKLLEEAVDKVKGIISDNIKRNNLTQSQDRYEIRVLYDYARMSDWLKLQKELKEAPYIKEVKEDAMVSGKVQFRIDFVGSPERLRNVLNSRGIFLTQHDNFYTITKK